VLGLPGSGKTRLLLERYQALTKDNPDGVFVVTFSRDQLKRITEAILREGSGREGLPPVFTYFTLAREIITASGRRSPRVVQALEEGMILQRAIRDNAKKLRSDYKKIQGSESFQKGLLETFHLFLQYGISSEQLNRLGPSAKDKTIVDLLLLYQTYHDALKSHGYVTYYDISWLAADVCKDVPKTHPLRNARAVLVDDFQDIDAGQFELLKTLVPPDGDTALSVFGDPMGAYFGFRGTHPRYLMNMFPEIYRGETMRIPTESLNDEEMRRTLSALAREVIGADADAYGPKPSAPSSLGPLFDGAGTKENGTVGLQVSCDEVEEIYGAAARVHDLITLYDRRPNDIALVTNDKRRYEPLLRAAFTQRGISVDTGRPYQDVFRRLVHALLLLVDKRRDVATLQALVTSPFYSHFRDVLEIHVPRASDPAREAQHVVRALNVAKLPKDPGKMMSFVINQWLRPACDSYQRDNDDETPFGFLSLLGKRWEEYTDASKTTGQTPSIRQFMQASGLFRAQAASPMPSDDEVGLYSCREVKGRFFRDVIVLGCSELLFPSAMRRESIMPTTALQQLFDTVMPDARVRVYGARSPDEHLHEEYHLLYHSLTRALETLTISAPREFAGHDHPAPAAILDENLSASIRTEASSDHITPPQIRFAKAWVRESSTPDIADRLTELSPFGRLWNLNPPSVPEFAIERFPLSKSSLERYLKCPRLFFYEKVLRVPQDDTNALIVGNLFHRVMASLGEQFPNKRQLHEGMSESMIEQTIEKVIEEERTKGQVVAVDSLFGSSLRFHLNSMVRGSLKLDDKESEDYEIEQVEEGFRMTHDGWEFRGQFDLVEKTTSGGTILDYKTGDFKKTGANLRKRTLAALESPGRANWQVPIYVWGYRDAMGKVPDAVKHLAQQAGEDPFFVTLYIRGREEDVPPVAISKKRVDQAYSYLLESEIKDIMDRATEHAEEVFVERTTFEKTEDRSHCRNCMFNRLCDRRTD